MWLQHTYCSVYKYMQNTISLLELWSWSRNFNYSTVSAKKFAPAIKNCSTFHQHRSVVQRNILMLFPLNICPLYTYFNKAIQNNVTGHELIVKMLKLTYLLYFCSNLI